MFQSLTPKNSVLSLSSIYFRKKQNMLQVYFRKKNKVQSKNVQTEARYQFKFQSFKLERGKLEFEIIFKFQ